MADTRKAPPGARAQAASTASDQRTRMVLDQVEKERVASDVKTARLKALRLAKEAEDRAYALANPPPPKPARKRVKT